MSWTTTARAIHAVGNPKNWVSCKCQLKNSAYIHNIKSERYISHAILGVCDEIRLPHYLADRSSMAKIRRRSQPLVSDSQASINPEVGCTTYTVCLMHGVCAARCQTSRFVPMHWDDFRIWRPRQRWDQSFGVMETGGYLITWSRHARCNVLCTISRRVLTRDIQLGLLALDSFWSEVNRLA